MRTPSYITDMFGLDSDWQIERSTMTVDQQEVILNLAPSVKAYQVSPDTIHFVTYTTDLDVS